MADAAVALDRRVAPVRRRSVRAGLLRKEWAEQRWRFFLGTMTLSGLLGGMLRAQLVPFNEAAMTVFWPIGLVMVIFLAMGPVASEKSDRTWSFLLAQPVSRADILMAKWQVGLAQLIGMLTIATVVGLLAMQSRGFYGIGTILQGRHDTTATATAFIMASQYPGLWLCTLAAVATVALSCWFTVLFIVLTRARNEFTAAMGGILLTIAVHAWLLQLTSESLHDYAVLNPIAPFVLVIDTDFIAWLPVVLIADVLLWIVLPLYLLRRFAGRAGKS